MRMKWVFRRDTIQGFFRLVRFLWERGEVGFGNGGYSAKLSVALDPAIIRFPQRDANTDWRFTLLGVRVHYCRSYGGIFA